MLGAFIEEGEPVLIGDTMIYMGDDLSLSSRLALPADTLLTGWDITDLDMDGVHEAYAFSGNTLHFYNVGFTMTFHEGWNMISPPFARADSSFAGLDFSPISPFYFDTETRGYEEDDYFRRGVGYFFLSDVDTSISYSGGIIGSYERRLLPGWHLLGGLSRDLDISDMLESPSFFPEAYIFDASTGTYYSTSHIKPGQAFWLWANDSVNVRFR